MPILDNFKVDVQNEMLSSFSSLAKAKWTEEDSVSKVESKMGQMKFWGKKTMHESMSWVSIEPVLSSNQETGDQIFILEKKNAHTYTV